MVVINDLPEKVINIESDCLIANLQAIDCRKGCPNCSANELFYKLEKVYEQRGYDAGNYKIKIEYIDLRNSQRRKWKPWEFCQKFF